MEARHVREYYVAELKLVSGEDHFWVSKDVCHYGNLNGVVAPGTSVAANMVEKAIEGSCLRGKSKPTND